MRCVNCPLSYAQHYGETNESDWYCLGGVDEDDMDFDKDDECGCKMHYKTIQKKADEMDIIPSLM